MYGCVYNIASYIAIISHLSIQKEETRRKTEMVSQVTRSSNSSELEIFPVDDQHLTSVKCQCQQFLKMLSDKGVSVETITKFIQVSAGYIQLWHCYISELLSSSIAVINDAEEVLAIGNTYRMLPAIIGQALMMLVCYTVDIALAT